MCLGSNATLRCVPEHHVVSSEVIEVELRTRAPAACGQPFVAAMRDGGRLASAAAFVLALGGLAACARPSSSSSAAQPEVHADPASDARNDATPAGPASSPETDIAVDATESLLTLAVARRLAAGEKLDEEAWLEIYETTAFRRLVEREQSLGRSFTRDGFARWVEDELTGADLEALAKTLEAWKATDFERLAEGIRPYLPADAPIRATVYVVLKPRDNSFVFDLGGDPAIFVYLDPKKSRGEFTNMVLHELHHIGFGTGCPPPEVVAELDGDPSPRRDALRWLGAFGEGLAMLAAAGGPDVHPHATSPQEDRARWDGDVARVREDQALLGTFFSEVLDGTLTGDVQAQRAFSFYGVQGPWYTVGWVMAAHVERTLGRRVLVQAFCDPHRILDVVNESVQASPPDAAPLDAWPAELVSALR